MGQSEDDVSLLVALRERQALLERLSAIQRSIVEQRALHEIFDQIVAAGCKLVGDEVGVLRLRDPSASGRSVIASSRGARQEFLAVGRRAEAPGIGAQAAAEGRLVVVDKRSDPTVRMAPGEWAAEGVRAGMAAPVLEGDEVVGSLGLASRDPNREYSSREQQNLLALAEHATLALNHARAIGDAARQAVSDSLTGLPNRALFLDRLGHALARGERSGNPVGVLFVDLDDFKTVNDSLGHRAGDDLLRAVARRFEACLRPADTIARLGGDEFAVLLDEIGDPGDAAGAARRLLDSLAEAFTLTGREVFVGASVGIAVGAGDAETLLRDADLAMYRAKDEGKGRYEAFAPQMHTDIVERMELEVDLKRAIERGELELAYQPIFSLRTGAVAGLEALVRWRHPSRGLLGPDRFIPLAEASGRIHDLGRWVLRTACHQGALWRAKYPALPGIQVGVNVSGAQLRDPNLVGEVAEALDASRLDPDGLTIEVTETVLMADLDVATRRLAQLKELGVDIAIDDFGVGHSSLRCLKAFPLDNLKVAKPFVDEIGQPDPRPPILRAILELADVFDLRAVAEGIEETQQAQALLDLGCELGQGHMLSRPVAAADADELILNAGLLGGPAQQSNVSGPSPLGRSEAAEGPAAAS